MRFVDRDGIQKENKKLRIHDKRKKTRIFSIRDDYF